MLTLRISRLLLLPALAAVCAALAPAAEANAVTRPPVTWLKGPTNYTPASRSPASIDRVVVHVTEGSFWGAVTWLRNPRAHVSSHYVISRSGKIVQLIHLSDIAWHAGHWGMNVRSVGIEHEGWTYGPGGFTKAQYEASAKLTAWLARRSLMPITRRHIVGHNHVPGGHGHTDPGPNWNWNLYLRLVRKHAGIVRLSVKPLVPEGPLRGIVTWRAKASPDIKRVEFLVDGRVVHVDRTRPFTYRLNTAKLANRRYKLQVHGIAGPGRYDVEGTWARVDNKTFALTSAGARPWMLAPKTLNLRVRPWGQKAEKMVFTVDGKVRAIDRKPPFLFTWSTKGVKPGRHVLVVVATSIDGRTAARRIPVVVPQPPKPKPKPQPKPAPKPTPAPPPPPLAIVSQSVKEGQSAEGLVLWRVEATGKPTRVEFVVDGVVRGADVAAPYTFGWDSAAEAPGPHRLTARAIGAGGKVVEATVTVTVPERPESASTPSP